MHPPSTAGGTSGSSSASTTGGDRILPCGRTRVVKDRLPGRLSTIANPHVVLP